VADTLLDLYDLDLSGMEALFAELGEKPFRARQAMSWLYKRDAASIGEITEFSAALRAKLEKRAVLILPRLVERQQSKDGTVKLLLEMADGERVETVLIPDEERLTQCVSTQAGCAMGCRFCRTASAGLTRHLTAGEIVAQVVAAGRYGGFPGRVTNIVFMGMGEPLHNFDNVVRAFSLLCEDHGLNITRRRITLSTSGLVDAMKRLPPEMVAALAVSLNATTDAVRDEIMPVNRRYPIAALLGAMKELPLPPRARYTIEYVLLGGVNDSPEDAKRLAKLLAGMRCKINLIAYNPHEASPYRAPSAAAVERFQTYLLEKHFTAVLRKSRGEDILAACGQLKAEREARC